MFVFELVSTEVRSSGNYLIGICVGKVAKKVQQFWCCFTILYGLKADAHFMCKGSKIGCKVEFTKKGGWLL